MKLINISRIKYITRKKFEKNLLLKNTFTSSACLQKEQNKNAHMSRQGKFFCFYKKLDFIFLFFVPAQLIDGYPNL